MELRVQLHLHTTESKRIRIPIESLIQPKQVIDIAKNSGIDAIAITDHNTTRAYSRVKDYAKKRGVLLISSIEIDAIDGHIIGLNVDEEIEKYVRKEMTSLEAYDLIREFDGISYIPHPFDIRKKGINNKVKEIDGIIEVFNSMNIFGFEDKYADIVASKLGRPKAVGADAHTPGLISTCITVVNSELDICSILKSIKAGNVRFENCRHITLKEMKEWGLERIHLSYENIKYKIKHGWEVELGYMILANNRFLKPLEKITLELGSRRPKSKIWDITTYFSYFLANLYAKFTRREFDAFVSTL